MDERDLATGVGVEIVLDSSEYAINAMPPGPPAVPAMRLRVVLLCRPEGGDPTVAVVRREGADEIRRVVLEPRPSPGDPGLLAAERDIPLLDDHGTPPPDGRYSVEVTAAGRPEPIARAAFRVVTIQ